MKSIMAVGIGLLLALVLGLLVVQGIFAPVLTRFFGLERAGPATLPLVLLLFAAAFSFYFGGMAASYKAPFQHRLHGVLVVPVAFVLSLLLNLVLGKGFLPGVDGAWAVGLVVVFLVSLRGLLRRGHPRGGALRPQPEDTGAAVASGVDREPCGYQELASKAASRLLIPAPKAEAKRCRTVAGRPSCTPLAGLDADNQAPPGVHPGVGLRREISRSAGSSPVPVR